MKIIEKIHVEKFRKLENLDFNFSQRLNAICGQNGTSKTSILGLIGHTFTYPTKYKTLLGKKFSTQFSSIFRFAYPTYDKAGDHKWITYLGDKTEKESVSYDRIEKDKKNRLRIRVGKSEKGSGKLHIPVIYLGMGRLFPLTLETEIKSSKSLLYE